MKHTKKPLKFKSPKSDWSFTSKKLSLYGGMAPIMNYLKRIELPDEFDALFPTPAHQARKFSLTHLMLSIILSSLSGVNRLTGIATFTWDPLIQSALGLVNGLNKDVISTEFKKLGQTGARLLDDMFGYRVKQELDESELEEITVDADSTVQTVYGKQEGAGKGFNPKKRGAWSYHPMIAFASELKLVINTWFRTGKAYTSNGIVEFLKQTVNYIPDGVKVFFRADSGFFNGELFDYLESLGWDYLVKVKFKGLSEFLKKQEWTFLDGHGTTWACEFSYKAKSWTKARTLKAVRQIKKYETREEFGRTILVPVYQYACYCSTLPIDVWATHEKYCERAVSETWIEQVKSQLFAGSTLTNNFWANDILWQLAVFSYNLSVMMRFCDEELHKEEHRTFSNWFIKIAAEIRGQHRSPQIRLYKYHPFRERWETFATQLAV
jgi:hypothetical protein